MARSTALVIMARYPEVGAVKTRLARVIGAERACETYSAFLRDLDNRFAGGPRTPVWAFHPPGSNFAALVSPRSRCIPQVGGELGARMLHAVRHLLAEGYGRVLIIGVDVPHVREEWLREAETALHETDVVLGPAEDGGYYLIGMRAPHDVFSGIAMGTPTVLAETVARAQQLGLRLHLLPKTFDIDEPADLLRLRDLIVAEDLGTHLGQTAALLQAWKDWLPGLCSGRISVPSSPAN